MNTASAARYLRTAPQIRMLAGMLAGSVVLFAGAEAVKAQPASQGVVATPAGRVANPKAENLARLMRPISVNFQEQRLEDVLTFIEEFSGADLEPRWTSDRTPDGLDPEATITLSVQNVSVLTLLERVLDQARGDFSENTWQFTDWGTVELGPKEILNRRKRVEIYDINDLLLEIPEYREVPEIDLQSVLQSGEGGGGQSPFTEDDEEEEEEEERRLRRVEELMDLIQSLVEPEQWIDNGGNGGSVRYYQGSLIVNAPDYMHRQLNGYPFWPSQRTTASVVNGRRYVTLDMDTGISTIDGFGREPVSAVVGGEIISSDDPPGGGGSTQPAPSKRGGKPAGTKPAGPK